MADRKLTDLQLERVLAGELSLEGATPADNARLEELRAENAAFLAQADIPAEVRAIERRAAQLAPAPKQPWWRWAFAGGGLLAAAAAVILVVRPKGEPDDDLRTKGDGITFVIHTPNRELASGDAVAAGEKIRFEIGAPKAGYVAVYGVDAAGTTTVYYPYGASAPAAYDPATRLLPGAIALDATPGAEHFTAVYSAEPFALDAVVHGERAGVRTAEVVLSKK